MADAGPTQSDVEPILCSLDPTSFQSRIAGIGDLNRDGRQSAHRKGLRLQLSYHPSFRKAVIDLMERERACCRFLSFSFDENIDSVMLHVEVPERARDAADDIFAHFLFSSPEPPGEGAARGGGQPLAKSASSASITAR